jgi:hypothetical protein
VQGRFRQLRGRTPHSRRCPHCLRVRRVVACPRRPPIQSPYTSRACVGGTRPGSGGTRDAANRSRYTGDACPACPSPRMAVSCACLLDPSHSIFTHTPSNFKGLLFCVTEDAPSVRRADAGKTAELCAARAFGSRRANYGTSHPPTKVLHI